ncbi:MAG: thioredoxin family protein [Leptolyngbya sp. BL-A-14]
MLESKLCITLTNHNFKAEVLHAQTPVLVDCWASWCGSFHQINPIYNELALEFSGQITIGRLDIATAEPLATQYGIRAVPTLLLFHNGQVLERLIGSVSKPKLTCKLKALLSASHVCRSLIACL